MTNRERNRNDGPGPENDHAGRHAEVVQLTEFPRGVFSLPAAVFRRIEHDLPVCMQRREEDSLSRSQDLRLPLVEECDQTVAIRTRNVLEITRRLEKAGHAVEVQLLIENDCLRQPAQADGILLETTKSARSDLTAQIHEFRERLAGFRYGQFVAQDQRHKFGLAAGLCAAFPQAPIVFVVASQDEVDQVAAELEARLREPVHRAFGLKAEPNCRISVATYMAFRSLWLCDAPFLIVPNWRAGFPRWMRELIHRPYADRIYFLRAANEKLSLRDSDGLYGRLGPVLLVPPAVPSAQHTFSVLRFGRDGVGRQERHPDRQRQEQPHKRKLYWRHHRRNQAIAGLVLALQSDAKPVTVLVETLEHARRLAKLLPTASVISRGTAMSGGTAPMIITQLAAAEWDELRPQTLIWAAGGPPSLWLTGWLKTMSDNQLAVQIIDLADGFSPEARQLAEARQHAHRDAGCHWRPLPNDVVRQVGRQLRQFQRREQSARTTPSTR